MNVKHTLAYMAAHPLPRADKTIREPSIRDLGDAAIAFVQEVAAMTKDGELLDGRRFTMENDDAYETLHSLIASARELAGITDPPDANDFLETECAACGDTREEHNVKTGRCGQCDCEQFSDQLERMTSFTLGQHVRVVGRSHDPSNTLPLEVFEGTVTDIDSAANYAVVTFGPGPDDWVTEVYPEDCELVRDAAPASSNG